MKIDLIVEKKSRQLLREHFGELKQIKKIFLIKDTGLWYETAKLILQHILPKTTVVKEITKPKKDALAIMPLEQYTTFMLEHFTKDKRTYGKVIYFLSNISVKDLTLYAQKNNITGEKHTITLHPLLQPIQDKHDQTITASRKSFDFIRTIFLKNRKK